jgi:hypothetical protein
MKRFKITVMVPQSEEVVVSCAQDAHNAATRMVAAPLVTGGPAAVIHSIEEIEEPVSLEEE